MDPDTSSDTAIGLNYQTARDRRRLSVGAGVIVLRLFVAYFLVSMATLPFINALWLWEIPLLALVQLPKTAIAGWLRKDVVMPAITAVGASSGSFSPDFLLARPYGMALAYLLVMGMTLLVLWWGRRCTPLCRWWAWAAGVLAVADFAMTLWLADGPGLTIY